MRISIDAKAAVKVGSFSRGGKSRVPTRAADHDFEPEATVTPVGIFLPASDELFVYGVLSKVTSERLVDRLVDWWETVKERFAYVRTLVINLDNGPENHSRRTQFMQRLVEFVQQYRITVRLAYDPPYHSKYKTIERCWGDFGTALERRFARFGGGHDPVCPNHDLERDLSGGRTGDDHVSDWGELDQGGDEGRGKPTGALATSAKVVCGHQGVLASEPG